jgi:hypothetical protein
MGSLAAPGSGAGRGIDGFGLVDEQRTVGHGVASLSVRDRTAAIYCGPLALASEGPSGKRRVAP